MSILVIGTAQLGFKYGIANTKGRPDAKLSKKILTEAINNGVKMIDTASAYGDSERVIGESLDPDLKNQVKIITKLSPLVSLPSQTGPSVFESLVDENIYGSMTRLVVDRIDTLLLHRIDQLYCCKGAIFNRLLFHLKQGNISSLGVSVQNPTELLTALRCEKIEHIQMPFSIVDWRWEEAIKQIIKVKAMRRLTIHIRSIYLQGLLLVRDAACWKKANHPNPRALFHWLDDSVNRFQRSSVQDLCVSFVNGLAWVDGVVIGMETYQQLEENLLMFSKEPLSTSQHNHMVAMCPKIDVSTLNPALWQQY